MGAGSRSEPCFLERYCRRLRKSCASGSGGYLFGTHELTCRLLPVFRAQGAGRIIQISSVLGLVSLAYRGAYNASKYALEGLSDTLRLELTGGGIHVVLIEPGPIESRFRQNAYAAFKANIDREHSAHRDYYLTSSAAWPAARTNPSPCRQKPC